jgi:hypothetical protein
MATVAADGAGLAARHQAYIAVGSLLLTSMLFSGRALRGFRPSGHLFVFGMLLSLFALVTAFSAMAVAAGYQQFTDPGQLLLLAVFSLCALAILFMVVMSWLPGWRYREPALLALLTLALGGLSLHGLNLITSVLDIPATTGSVILYADQPTSQHLQVNFQVTPIPFPNPPFPNFVRMEIVDPSTNDKPSSWALLLTGDARLTNVTTLAHQQTVEETLAGGASTALPEGPVSEPGQLFWDRLTPGEASLIIGQPITSYISFNATESAVSLPDFMVGSKQNTDNATMSTIIKDLGTPGTSSSGLSFDVDAGSVSPLNEVVTAIPPLTDPSELSWTFDTETAPAYKVIEQDALDSQTSYSFALAVLLGVAGAGLLASIQALVSAAASRKEPPATPPKGRRSLLVMCPGRRHLLRLGRRVSLPRRGMADHGSTPAR